MRTSLYKIIFVLISIVCVFALKANHKSPSPETVNGIAIVTYVSDNVDERSTRAFIKSVREFAGDYKNCSIYVVLADEENFPCESLKDKNVVLLPLEMEEEFRNYPLAIKAFAAAQVEKIVKDDVVTLVWFDPATLVLNSLENLDLENKYDLAIRPVTLLNNIGLKPHTPPDDYWTPIYNELALDYKNIPTVKTIADESEIQAYYNCEIFSVNPRLGFFQKWSELLTKFLRDEAYQKNACTTFQRRLFLHQAVLSGLINKFISPDKIKSLSLKSAYPFNQHDKLPVGKKVNSPNDLSAIIFDYAWERNPKWMDIVAVNEPLKTSLENIFIDYLKLSDNLYRMEGSCNSYLVTTKEGSVLIDPAGALISSRYFKKILDKHPLKAILLTHGHEDHCENLDFWKTDSSIVIIAQREITNFHKYLSRMNQFLKRRGAIWARKPIPSADEIKSFIPVVPTTTFIDEFTYELGGINFKMMHTPGETPDHSTIYIPELKAVFIGDNYYKYFINNATLRGTPTRPVLGYINALDFALSCDPELFLPGHDLPIVSKKIINKTITNFRDALQYLFDETIKGINEGKDVYTLMREIKLPVKYPVSELYGKVEWTVRGIYQETIGWFDENPSSMYSITSNSVDADLVHLAGGANVVADLAQKFLDGKEYEKVLHLTDAALNAEPYNKNILDVRIKALKGLKSQTRNFIQNIWLDYGIRTAEEKLNSNNE